MQVLNDFKDFYKAKQTLQNEIGYSINYDIELNLVDKYSFGCGGCDLHWDFEDGEFQYSEEASLIKEFDDCEMYLVRSCMGNKFIFVFDKTNKIDDNAVEKLFKV